MPKEEWGVKRVCPTTGRRFYDLNKTPIVSPYTGEVVLLDENTKTRVAVAEKVEPKKSEEETAIEDDSDLLVDDDENSDSDIDDDLLEEDEDDSVSLDDIADVAANEDDT